MFYEVEVAGIKRQLQLYRVSDSLSIAAFILFGDVEITKAAAKELLKKAPEFDVIMTAEAKSIPLIYEMAYQAGKNDYVIARKGVKVYMTDPIDVEVESITTQHKQTLYLGQEDAAKMKDKKVLIIDDVISTGESLKAMEKIVEKAGGNIVAKMAIFAEGDAMGRDDIIVLEELPVFDENGNKK
ncbi:MAG: phosphoribosyltransferase family protein [Eubacteriales bacterium]|nr:phosphoribosyltransferase family protein [Eubacteriales bacterium]MDY3332317.1 phosphoribosyltransferase family protein [Gallibacter sp.]